MNELFYVMVVPTKDNTFSQRLLDYGIDYEQAEKKVRWYINDHGLRFKKNDKVYPALIKIYKISDRLPKGYKLFKEGAKK